MKKCINCNTDLENGTEVCWNCLYSFADKKVLEKSQFKFTCPHCDEENSAENEVCKKCGKEMSIKLIMDENDGVYGNREIYCQRCNIRLYYRGNYKFQEKTLLFAPALDYLLSQESFDIYYCPQCNKAELFLNL
jgi:Zn finger protein HypA/HybF involved in hydrogenase expression